MPVQMTREEYQKKYGSQPVRMTRAEYDAKYGSKSVIPDTTWKADLKQGWQGALDAFDQGMERIDAASARPTLAGRTLGRLGAGFRFAGDTLGSLGEGAFRALPGGTTVSDTIGNLVSGAADIAKGVPGAEGITKAYGALPQPVRQTIGDVGNIALGGAGIAGAVTVPTVGGSIVKTTGKSVVNNAPDIITKDVPTLRAEKVTQGYMEQNTRLKSVGNSFTKNTKTITTPGGDKVTITPVDTLAKYNIAPEVDKGTILMGDYAQRTGALGKIRESVESIDDELDTLIQNNKAGIPIDTFKQNVYSVIERNDDLKRSAKVASTKSKIDSAFEDYKASYGDTLSEAEINEIRKVMNRDWNPDTMDTSRAIGDAAREIVYSVTPDMRAKALLQEQGNLLAAKKYADTVNGTKVVGGRIGNYAMRTAGAILGTTFDKVPVVGPMVGMLGGEYAARALQQSQFKSLSAETKALLQKPFQRSNNIVPTKSASMKPNNASIQTIKAQPEAPTQIPSTQLSTATRQGAQKSSSLPNSTIDDPAMIKRLTREQSTTQKGITQKVKDWYKASGLDDERGFIKVPYIRDDIGSYVQSNPRGRLLDVEARKLFNIFKDEPTADESAMYVVRQFLSGKSGGGINRTELATALDILRNNAKKIYVAQRPAQRAPSNKSVMPKPKQKAEPKSKEKSLYSKIKDFLFPPGIPRDRGMINPKAIADDLTGKTSKTDDLLTEARKYKSADEFVKAQGRPFYRATVADFDPALLKRSGKGSGLYVTPKKETAASFLDDADVKAAGETRKMETLYVSPDARVLKTGDLPPNLRWDYEGGTLTFNDLKKIGGPQGRSDKIVQWASKNGYDVVVFGEDGYRVIVNPDVIRTPSQLTDIYNRAHATTPQKKSTVIPKATGSADDALMVEARKHKSVDEFVKAQGKEIYHATDSQPFDVFDATKSAKGEQFFNPLGQGMYLSSNKDFVSRFGKNKFEYVLPKGAKTKIVTIDSWSKRDYHTIVNGALKKLGIKYDDLLLDEKVMLNRQVPNTPIESLNSAEVIIGDIAERLGKKGSVQEAIESVSTARNSKYDAIIYRDTDYALGADEILVPDISKLKTRSQLTDIWNKAHSKSN